MKSGLSKGERCSTRETESKPSEIFRKVKSEDKGSFRVTLNFRLSYYYTRLETDHFGKAFSKLGKRSREIVILANKVRIIRLGFPKHSVALARQPAGYTAVVGIRTLRFQRSLNKIRDRKSS